MIELFSRGDEAYFARTLGVNNLRAHFGNLEKELRKEFDDHDVTEAGAVVEAQEILATSPTFQELVVQRSRAYARESQIRETGNAAVFPERKPPQVAEYSIRKTYGKLLDDVEKAFSRDEAALHASRSTTRSPTTRAPTSRSTRSRRTASTRSSG